MGWELSSGRADFLPLWPDCSRLQFLSGCRQNVWNHRCSKEFCTSDWTGGPTVCFKLVFLAAWYGSVPFGRKMIPIRSESCQALRFVGMISLRAVLLSVVQGLMQIELEASGSFIWSFATVRLKGFYVVGELSKNAGVRGADIFSSVKLIALLQCGSFGSCHQGSLPFAQWCLH